VPPRKECPGGMEWEGEERAVVPCEWLHDDFLTAAGKAGLSPKGMQTVLGIRFKKLLGAPAPNQKRWVTVWYEGADGPVSKQEYIHTWTFPSLTECRSRFDRLTKTQWDWPEVERENY